MYIHNELNLDTAPQRSVLSGIERCGGGSGLVSRL
jgi:hypothetical protein